MSKPITRLKPASVAVAAAPTMPPAGPERIASFPSNIAASVSPPEDCMKKRCVCGSSVPIAAATRST